jgi:3-oxoacyl-[acyl-carrier-protein] synthase-3
MQPASGIAITGVGHQLPALIEDNETLCRNLRVTPAWIVEKTGIQRRYLAGEGETASDYAVRAARKAMLMAGIDASAIDMVICCTFSADYRFPPLSAKVHLELGLKGGQVYDLQANCAGFISGLTAASDRMRIDAEVRHALVIGVEFNSRFIDRRDADTAIYCSDGASAVVLGRVPEAEAAAGLVASAFFTDSTNYEAVRLRGGGSSYPLPSRAERSMEMNGLATWKQAITHLPKVIRAACAKAGLGLDEIDFLIFHQANLRLIEFVMARMHVAMNRTFTNVQEIGNTGAASLGIALSEAVEQGLLKLGDRVLFAAVGAGFNYSASIWQWALPGGQR